MATDVFINIKDLPELTEISFGDYILLETSTGTHIMDFKNFIIPTTNTIISTTVEQNTTSIISLSSSTRSSVETLSGNIDSLSGSVTNLKSRTGLDFKYASTVITIPTGSRQASNVLSNAQGWTTSNLIVTPMNAYAARFHAYPVSVNASGNVTIEGSFTSLTIVNSAIVTTNIPAELEAVYNVIAIKNS